MGNAMMKVLVMLLPWLMAKADLVIDYLLRRKAGSRDVRVSGSQDSDKDV